MPDDVGAGRQVAAVRLSRNRTQSDVARRAGFTRPVVSRVERGLLDGVTVGTLRSLSRALGMPPLVAVGWRGPEIDRLLDEAHAALVEATVALLVRHGWIVVTEYSFNHFGERGAMDILAWHPAAATLLIVEIKSRLWDLQDMLGALDRKRRLVPGLARREFGWNADSVGVLLVMPETRSHRASIERHRATFRTASPLGQVDVKRWLERPIGGLRGILFLNNVPQASTRQLARRKRARPTAGKASEPGSAGESAGGNRDSASGDGRARTRNGPDRPAPGHDFD
jgi:transcriptional regulator with XRE-family HTH domain